MGKKKLYKNNYIVFISLLVIISLSVGFSAFQKELLIDDILFKVRLHKDTRVSDVSVSSSNGAVSNFEEFNTNKLLGNVTFDSSSSYILYKVDLTNYGNVKTGLLNIENNGSAVNYSICDSNGSNCTNDYKTAVCNASNCTLGSTKEIYLKVSSSTSGTKSIDLDLDFEPYNDITYTYFQDNTSSFENEIMSNDTYTVTIASKPEEIEVTGTATINYNKNTGVLTLSNVESDISLHAKYLATEVAQNSYSGSNPNNYVSFNNTLYRIVTKENIDDGYSNTELRAKIIKHESIGKYKYANAIENEMVIPFNDSTLNTTLNTTYYNSLSSTSKELIETFLYDNDHNDENLVVNFSLLDQDELGPDWINSYEQYLSCNYIYPEGESALFLEESVQLSNVNHQIVYTDVETQLDTHPVTYLKPNVLIVGGSGTSSDPYQLELSSNGLQPNPTKITGKTLTVNGSNQTLVEEEDKVGTVYYSTSTQLNENNYTDGSTTKPSASNVGNYTIYYYIPAGSGYKAKAGSVRAKINGITYTVTYQKGSNVSAIGKNSDTCTTTGSSLSCSVTLPSITPNAGYESVGWGTTNGATTGTAAGTSYTLNANGVVLYANAVVQHNYINTNTNTYYGTLQSAFSAVANNQTIKVLQNTTETAGATLASGKTGVKLDLNGKTVTSSATNAITNNGQLDIYSTVDNGTLIGSGTSVVSNNNILTVNNTSSSKSVYIRSNCTATSTQVLYNGSSGTMTLKSNSNIIYEAGSQLNSYGVQSYGLLNINGASISNTGVQNGSGVDIVGSNGRVVMTSGTINSSYSGIICSSSYESGNAVEISGGTIYSINDDALVAGAYDSNIKMKITGGTLSGNDGIRTFKDIEIDGENVNIIGRTEYGISSGGATDNLPIITIKKGNITGYMFGVASSNKLYMSGGTVIGENNSGVISTTSKMYITGGIIKGKTSGINTTIDEGVSEVYIGENDSTVNTNSPVIEATGTSSNYGILNEEDDFFSGYSEVYFYDGIIKSASGTGYAINHEPDGIPNNYKIQKTTTSGVESAILVPIEFRYQNTTTNTKYETLQEAFNAVANNQTIKVLDNATESTVATLTNTKTGIKLDLNGKTITTNVDNGITNNGSLDIYSSQSGGAIVGTGNKTILNNGTLTTNVTASTNTITIRSTTTANNGETIRNSSTGTITLKTNTNILFDSNTQSNSYVIYSYGSININGAIISNNNTHNSIGILAGGNAKYVMTSGGISSYSSALSCSSTYTASNAYEISGGTIYSENDAAISTGSSDTEININITGGTISGTTGISTFKNVTVNGSSVNIIGRTTTGIYCKEGADLRADITINNGTVQGYNDGLFIYGSLTMTGGTVIGQNRYGISSYVSTLRVTGGVVRGKTTGVDMSDDESFTILYLGENDSTVSTTSPSIEATGTSNNYGIDIVDDPGTVLYFYDGVIKSASGTGYAISRNPSTVATGYKVQKTTTNGVESAILVPIVYSYQNTTTNVEYETLNDAFTAVANNQTIKVLYNVTETTPAELSSSKTGIKLDLNGKTINLGNNYIINNGELDIYNTSSTVGTISDSNIAMENRGTLSFNATSSTNRVVFTSTNLAIGNVYGSSNLTINNNAEVIVTAQEKDAIQNNGLITITGGLVSSTRFAIYNYANGVLNITGGTISAGGCGIYSDGTVTLGENDSTVSTSSPVVESTSTSGGTGLFNYNGVFNFYDGIVRSSSGVNSAISGDPNSVPDGYQVYEELNNGVESAYLVKIPMLMQGTINDATTNYLRTNIAKQDIETITFANSLGNHVANGTDCFDVSVDEDGKVLAWVTDSDNDGLYEMTIGANDKVILSSGKYLFRQLTNLTSINGMEYLDTSHVTNMVAMFANCTNLTSVDLSHFDTSKVTSMGSMFSKSGITSLDLSGFNTSSVTSMGSMFQDCTDLTSLNLSSFNTSLVDSFIGMFKGCTSLATLNLSTFNTSSAINMSAMFQNCSSLTSLNLSSFNTSQVTTMQLMFCGCSSLTSLNLSSFNTSNVKLFKAMFNNCSNLVSVNLSSFNTSSATDMNHMFYGCGKLTSLDVTNFNTSSVTDMGAMFYGCSSLTELDLTSFDTSLVTDMSYMFNRCWSIITIYASSSFVTTSVTTDTYMFLHTEHLVGGMGTRFNGSYSGKEYARIDDLPDTPGYFTSAGTKVASFYYNSNTTSGTFTLAKGFASCVPATGQSSCTVTIPSVVTSSIGKYNSAYNGVHTSRQTMGSSSLTIDKSRIFYANYSSPVTENYYNGSAYASRTIYRNEYFYDNASIASRLSTTNTGTENYTPGNGANGSTWVGYSTGADSVVEYNSVQLAANTSDSTLYNVYSYNINYQIGNNVSSIGATSDSCNTYASSSSSLTCSVVLPSITPNSGYVSTGWSALNGGPSNLAEGETFILTASGNTLYANAIDNNYLNTSTNESYRTLNEAFSDVANNQTIRVLKNTTETTTATLASDKTGIKLDINGKTITSSASNAIVNNGTLDVYSSNGSAILESNGTITVLNSGTMSFNNTDSTNSVTIRNTSSDTGARVINCAALGTLTLKSNVTVTYTTGTTNYRSVIVTLGVVNIDGANIINNASGNSVAYDRGIVTSGTDGRVVMSSGTINTTGYAIYNGISTSTTPPAISVSGGTITSSKEATIFNKTNGTISITGGTITPGTYGIYNDSSGSVIVSGSNTRISNTSSIGIYNRSTGTVTITNAGITSDHCIENVSTGTISISGSSTISCVTTGIINNGILNISSGSLDAGNTAIDNTGGSVTITGGKVEGQKAIESSGGTITLGINNATVNTTPLIYSTSSSNSYGIRLTNSATFNFYDGLIRSASGSGYAISANPNNLPSGYSVYKYVSSGMEYARLEEYKLMAGTTGDATTNFLRTTIAKQNIEKVTFTNTISGHTPNGTNCWDVSKLSDGKVLLWATDSNSNGKYEVTIGSASGIVYLSSAYCLFYSLSNLTTINGMQYVDSSKVNSLSAGYMFSGCSSLTSVDLSNFDTSKVTNMSSMFYNCASITTLNLSNFVTTEVTKMNSMFGGCQNLTTLNISNFNTEKVNDMNYMFALCEKLTTLNLSHFNTDLVTNMSFMFYRCYLLSSLDISNFNTANVTNMKFMFDECQALTSLNLSHFNTSNVTDMSFMFSACTGLTSLNVSSFNTVNVTTMNAMFQQCDNLTTLNVSSFNTSNVTNMSAMFNLCKKLTSLNLSNFDTSKVTTMHAMFQACENLTSLNVSSFTTPLVTDFEVMFYGCKNVTSLDVSGFTGTSATNTSGMFRGCTNLVTLYASANLNGSNISTSTDMFTGDTKLKGGNGTTFNSSYTDKTYARIDQSGTPGYFTYKVPVAPTNVNIPSTSSTINRFSELNSYVGGITQVGNELGYLVGKTE